MRPITGLDEVTFSVLEPLLVHLQTVVPSSLYSTADVAKSNSSALFTTSYETESLTPLQRRIFDALKTAEEQDMNEGAHIGVIADRIGASRNSVMAACEELTDLGLAYTTVDFEHVSFFPSYIAINFWKFLLTIFLFQINSSN